MWKEEMDVGEIESRFVYELWFMSIVWSRSQEVFMKQLLHSRASDGSIHWHYQGEDGRSIGVVDVVRLRKSRTEVSARKILILERDKFSCVVCGAQKFLTIDHLPSFKPKKRGAAIYYPIEHCQTLCASCHLKKNRDG